MNKFDLDALMKRYEAIGGADGVIKPRTDDERSGFTRLFLNNDGASKYDATADGTASDIIYKHMSIEFETKADHDDDGNEIMKIQGWASTIDKDLEDEIILPSAFESSLADFLDKGIMLFMHDWWSLPVGKWLKADIVPDKGLYVEGVLLPTTAGKDIQVLVEHKAIKNLSVGFRVRQDEYDYDKEERTITDLELLEISLLVIPANPTAIFEQAKQYGLKSLIDKRFLNRTTKKEKTTMAIGDAQLKKLEKLSADYDDAQGTVEARFKSLTKTQTELATLVKANDDKRKEVDKGLLSASEFKTYIDKRKDEFTKLVTDLADIETAVKEKKVVQYAVKDWRGLMKNFSFLKDEAGIALPPIHQKAYKLLNLPVDYDKTESGWLVKAVRNLNDVCLIVDAFYRDVKSSNYRGMHTLDCFQTMADVIEKHFDNELGASMKALATGNVASGAEWIPSLMSGELEILFRLRPSLVNFIRPAWQMPSATAKWPIMTGAAIAYLADEAATDNPTVLRKATLASSNILFDTRTFAGAIPTSRQMIEDTIVDLVPTIREELVIALNEAEEDAMVNGDNSSSHFDTGLNLTSGNDDARVAYLGLRKIARTDSNTFDTQSVVAGVGDATAAFVALDIRYNRQLLGVLGIDPSSVLHVTSINAYYKALTFSEVTKANEFGFPSTWLTGRLPALDGAEIYISSKMRSDLNAVGIFDNSVTDFTSWLTLHKTSFMPGERRGIMLEFKYDPEVQQSLFIATMRRDFKKIRPATQKPVAEGFNIVS